MEDNEDNEHYAVEISIDNLYPASKWCHLNIPYVLGSSTTPERAWYVASRIRRTDENMKVISTYKYIIKDKDYAIQFKLMGF